MNVVSSVLLYIIVFAVSAIIVQYGYRHKSKLLQVLGLLLPIILGGFRYDVGLDYMSYFNAYADIVNPQSVYRYEGTPGLEYSFHFIAQLSHYLNGGPILMFTVYCAVTVFAFYGALRLSKPGHVGYALFFFYSIFFLNSFNIMRQGAAMSIGSLAIIHYIHGNKRKAFFFILLASLFHISALLLFAFIAIERILEKRYLIKRKIKKFSRLFMKMFILSLGIVVVGLSVASVGLYIYEVTGRIGDYDTKLSLGVVFKYFLVVICTHIAIYAWSKFNTVYKNLTLFVALGMIVYALGIVHNEAARIGMYLIVLTPILAAVTYDHLGLDRFRNKFFLTTGLVILSTLYIVFVHIGSGEGVRYDYQISLTSPEYQRLAKDIKE